MILAIDIGGTYIKYALLTEDFMIQKKWKKETVIFDTSAKFYDYLCQDLKITADSLDMVGISMPGILDKDFKIISKTSPVLSLLYQTIVTKEVSVRCQSIPVIALNDAKSAGMCEVTLGNGKDTSSSVYWLIGTGIGGALFNGTELIEGVNRIAGEFSHIPIRIENNQTVGLAQKTSIKSLVMMYNQKVSQEKAVSKGIEISIRSNSGDKVAMTVIDEWINNNVQALLMITMIFNPEIICIGGEISNDVKLMERIKNRYCIEIEHPFSELVTTKLTTCHYKNDANLIGAAIYARKKLSKI